MPSATVGPQVSRAGWVLAPDERPTRWSVSLQLVVSEQGCSDGHSAAIYGDPFVFYEKTVINIIFAVISVPRVDDCQPPPAIPTTVVLRERLGSRWLGYAFHRSHGLPVYWTDPLADMAAQRVQVMAGLGACESALQGDRSPLSAEEERDILAEVGPNGGSADGGRAFVGDWTEAARFFGAIEAYSDNHVYNGFVTRAARLGVSDPSPDKSSLVLTRLHNWYLPDGQQVWYPTFLFSAFHDAKLFQSAPCAAG